jgi:uncharacterized protein YbaA (DUF1428 family)
MSYIDGFVIAVPTPNKQEFINHAKQAGSVFKELGATRVLECWGNDVPDGKLTDFRKAVQAKEHETVVFSWIEWPDKATRDAAMAKMDELMKSDDRLNPDKNPMPFDGKRLIYGGFGPGCRACRSTSAPRPFSAACGDVAQNSSRTTVTCSEKAPASAGALHFLRQQSRPSFSS